MDLDFLEIGTSNFDTFIERVDDNTRGISVEPLKFYLDQLSEKKNVIKVNAAITDQKKMDFVECFFIPEETIIKNNLPLWFKGCNCINNYHPLHIKHNVTHLVSKEIVKLINISDLLIDYNVRSIKHLKIDTEGHDVIILHGLYNYLKNKNSLYHPLTITFETNEHTTKEKVDEILNLFINDLMYEITFRGYDTTIQKKIYDDISIENSIPRKLHMIWVGNTLQPDYVKKNFLKWKELMPDWECFLWTDKDLENLDKSIFPIDLINTCEIPAQKADILRYFLIYNFGGIYVDCDITPYKSLEPIVQFQKSFVVCHDLNVTWEYIAIGFFASSPKHVILKEVCEKVLLVELNTSDVHMKTGPRLFGSVVLNSGKEFSLLPIESFYRNLKGETKITGEIREEDEEERFGNHFFAATWVK
jgi:mannosyltransferase OCH1-like enzyme